MEMFDPDLDFVNSGVILGKPLEFLIGNALYPVWESLKRSGGLQVLLTRNLTNIESF